jgi:type I restriction enzyme R subunit
LSDRRGDVMLLINGMPVMTFREHVTKYRSNAKHEQINALIRTFGLDESKLSNLLNSGVTEANLNQYGRFDELKNSVDKTKAKTFFEEREGMVIPAFKVNVKIADLLKKFILDIPDAQYY